MDTYRARVVDDLLHELLAGAPALLIVGARATGKTTTATRLARTIVRLDQPGQSQAFHADPDAALRDLPEPVLLDEWQVVPAVLGAVKRAVDTDPRPGRFILTGSVRADLQAVTWPGTGRLIRVAMHPMTVAERRGATGRSFIDRLLRHGDEIVAPDPPDLRGYVELAMESGFPEASLRLDGLVRARWLESYVTQVLTRDVEMVDQGRDPDRLRRWFEAYALNASGVVNDKTLYDAAGIDRRTAVAYEQLLTNLMVVDALPAWTSSRLQRIVSAPKRMVVDPGVIAGALRLDVATVMRDGDLLGRIIETFVMAQLRPETEVAVSRPRLHHLRTEAGRHEIDLVVEVAGGGVVALEVKADSAPGPSSIRHLAWMRDALGERFLAGAVLHTGPRSYRLGDRIDALPIAAIWS